MDYPEWPSDAVEKYLHDSRKPNIIYSVYRRSYMENMKKMRGGLYVCASHEEPYREQLLFWYSRRQQGHEKQLQRPQMMMIFWERGVYKTEMKEIKGDSRKYTCEMVPMTPTISIMSANWFLLKWNRAFKKYYNGKKFPTY